MVAFNANSQVEIGATDDTAILGFAMGDATGTTNEKCLVRVPISTTIMKMSTNATTTEAIAATDRALKLGLLVESGISYVDLDEATAELFVIVGLADIDGVTCVAGDSYARVFVKVLPTALQLGGAAESA